MFDNLSDKLQRVFKNLRGEGKLTAENMEEALREIRVALLEADVHFKVVKQFIEQVKAKGHGRGSAHGSFARPAGRQNCARRADEDAGQPPIEAALQQRAADAWC